MAAEKMLFLSGNEALARGAWEAGLNLCAAYPGTPSTEIVQNLSYYSEINSQWSVNEKVAYEVAFGASLAGARSLYACKHVGLNVAMDPLMTSTYIGVNGGFVVVVADDPGMHSSQNEQDTRLAAKFAKVPILEPSSPKEAYEFAKKAFDISEKFDTPVIIKMTTRISHTRESFIPSKRKEVPVKKYETNIPKNVMVPGFARLRHIEVEKRLDTLKEFAENTELNFIEEGSKELGIITDSVSYLYVKESYPQASVLKLGFCWPFPDKLVKKFSESVQKCVVAEELEPFIEEHAILAGAKISRRDKSYYLGELMPHYIKGIVESTPKEPMKSGPARKPSMCPGCSHAALYSVLQKFNLVVSGDIGCYTLGALPPYSVMHTCVCMGGSITVMEGMSKIQKGEKNVCLIGDSTFVHTGVAGLINAVYNNAKGVIFILDNSTTAMTGTQPHPATGESIKGEKVKKLIIEDVCKVCGVDNVDVVNPFDKNFDLEKLIEKRVNEDALSVIISRFPCQLVLRKEAKKKNTNVI